MSGLVSFLCGALFAVGLGVSGMTQPAKVIGFLDVTGRWDPSLALVMGGAVGINLLLFRVILGRPRPLLGTRFSLPGSAAIDGRLVGGAALFGVGWGLSGYCPGPAVVALAGGSRQALVFAGAMVGGMLLHDWAGALLRPRAERRSEACG